jgi:hypothetical protein
LLWFSPLFFCEISTLKQVAASSDSFAARRPADGKHRSNLDSLTGLRFQQTPGFNQVLI